MRRRQDQATCGTQKRVGSTSADMEEVQQELKLLNRQLEEQDAKRTRVVVVPRERGPKLSGRPATDQEPEVIEWAEDMRRMTADMSNPEGVQFILDHLAGTAKDEVRLCPAADRDTPEKIIRHVLNALCPQDTPSSRWREFYSRVQQAGETPQEFSLQLMKLLRRVELVSPKDSVGSQDAALCERFASGLADPSLRREVRRIVQENPEIRFPDLRSRVISWENPPAMTVTRAARATENAVQGQLDRQAGQIQATQEAVNQLCEQVSLLLANQAARAPDRDRGRHTGMRCFNCDGMGHIAAVCPSPRRRQRGNGAAPASQPSSQMAQDQSSPNVNPPQ